MSCSSFTLTGGSWYLFSLMTAEPTPGLGIKQFGGTLPLYTARHNTELPGTVLVILGSRAHLHAVRNLLLHHDRHQRSGTCFSKSPMIIGAGYMVWKIRNHLDRPAAISLLHDLVDIHLQYVIVDDGHIVVLRKGLVQNREKILVYLHRHNLSGTLRKILGNRSYSGPISSTQSSFVMSAALIILFMTWASMRKF